MFNQTSIEALSKRLQFDFPGVPVPAIEDAVICAAQRFCTGPMFQVQGNLSNQLQECYAEVSFAHIIPKGMQLNGILSVEWCGCCIDPVTEKCNPCANGWRICTDTSIEIVPAPEVVQGATLDICISVEPSDTTCTLPESLVDRYRKVILDYARHDLYSLPNQKWTDLRAGDYYKSRAAGRARQIQARLNNQMHIGQPLKARGRRWVRG